MNTTDDEFKEQVGAYLDVQSAIDYYIFAYGSCALDNLARNMIMLTYDGVKWYCSAYDLDCTWGNTPWGNSLVSSDYLCPEQYQETNSLLWQRIVSCFTEELKERYAKLRGSVLSKSNLVITLEKFTDNISNELYSDDLDKYPTIPLPNTNNSKQIRKFMSDRIDYVDTMIPNLGEDNGGDTGGDDTETVAVTALSLSKDSLEFSSESTYQPNSEYFTDAQLLEFESGYYINGTAENGDVGGLKTGTSVNDNTTLEMIPVEKCNSMIVNPNGCVIKAVAFYAEDESYVSGMYAMANTDKLYAIEIPDAAKYARVQAATPSYMYMAKVTNWIKLEDALVPEGTGDKYTGAIIPAIKGNVVLWRIVGNTATYYTAVASYTDSNGSGTNYITRYKDTNVPFKCAEITDDACTYIGFKVNRALYNEGGYIEYVILDSMDDAVITEQGAYSTENVVATITPSDASNQNVVWSIDNDIVDLTTSGLTCIVSAKSIGTATLTCIAEDTTNGTISDTCAITVN